MTNQPVTRVKSSILVVDDNVDTLEYLDEVLTSEGHECHCVTGVLAAISHLAEQHSPTDLVLTDINMPVTDGLDFLHTIRSVQPELPVVMLSGLYDLTIAVDALPLWCLRLPDQAGKTAADRGCSAEKPASEKPRQASLGARSIGKVYPRARGYEACRRSSA